MRRLSFASPKDCSPRAPQPALARGEGPEGDRSPLYPDYPRGEGPEGGRSPLFPNFQLLCFIFYFQHYLFLFIMFAGRAYICRSECPAATKGAFFMQLQANFNFLNSARQLWNKVNAGPSALNAHVRNTGGQVYGLSGPTAASRVNGNYQRYLQLQSGSPGVVGRPDSSRPSSPAPSRPASNPLSSYSFSDNGSIGSSSAKSWDYLNADLARQYEMSRETAYQEALSNTAYQRSVADMQAAGLNPAAIFGAGSGYQASGVGYVSAATPSSGGSGYIAQTGVSRRGSSAKAQTDYNLTGKQYALIQLLGAGVGALTTKSFAGALSGAAIGRYVAQYIGNK